MSATKVEVTNLDINLLDMIEASEPGNAVRLAAMGRGRIHYVDSLGIWLAYRDGRWEMDVNGIGLQELAKKVPQSIFAQANTLNPETDEEQRAFHLVWGRKSNTEPAIKRMITLARGLDGIRINHDELDAKPWLFNCQNGTFDFMNNTFREHDPGDLLTKRANVWYDPDAKCPAWMGYLNEWQPDHSVQDFLAEITGSGLTGIAVQNLFVNVGPGRNGKGTFYKQIQYILGDYAGTAPEDMLIESRFKVHDEEKARLRGCRFLVAPETGVGDRLDEAGIKNLTGGDLIHGRHLYGRPFDFKPTHTAFLHTNHRPQIRGTDPAIWSRVIEIPWNVIIQADKRDMLIDDKLEAERSGILNWLIAGAQRFKRHGVKPPKSIMDATEEYRQSEDTINRFMEDSMEAMTLDSNALGEVHYIQVPVIRDHYEKWCIGEGTRPWSAQAVGKELRRLGWKPDQVRINGKVIRVWIRPNSGTAVTEQPQVNPSFSSSVPSVPSVQILNPTGEIEGNKASKGVNIGSDDTAVLRYTNDPMDLSDAEREADHREWLRSHGYPVPPTDEEIEAYEQAKNEEWAELQRHEQEEES